MGHLYPLAPSAEAALDAPAQAARTRHEAETLAGARAILALETEWLELDDETATRVEAKAASGCGQGFVQRYENAEGQPVLAVTYWKLAGEPGPETSEAPEEASQSSPAAPASPQGDHTDDLYFRAGRTRKKRRTPRTDPRQLDLFHGPDQQGYEHPDPDNPGIVLTGEEGDGTTFGG